MPAAAFFDLDRTLLRRSSALALAGSFRERGLIGRGQLAKAALWQLLFAARGAGAETVRSAVEDGMRILEVLGSPVAVNPDRGLRRIARERGWPALGFSELAFPAARRVRPALYGIPLALGAGAALLAVKRRAA